MASSSRTATDTLHANIHTPFADQPFLAHDSNFFAAASLIESVENELPDLLVAERQSFSYRSTPALTQWRGEQGEGTVLELRLKLPDFPDDLAVPQVLVVGTPENNAITLGRLYLDNKQHLRFQLPRFHTGVPAQEDLAHAMFQAAQVPQLQQLWKSSNLKEELYTVYLTREGHLTEWHKAVYYATGQETFFSLAHAEHSAGDSFGGQFKRVAKVCPINLEGLAPASTKILAVGDNTASGMQQVAVLERILHSIAERNGGSHKVEHLLIISPLLTLYGASAVALWAGRQGLRCTFVCSGALLGCNLPDRYFSPVLEDDRLTAQPELIAATHAAHGPEAAGKACVRCNWTASFMASDYAIARSEEELALYGSSNARLQKHSQKIAKKWLQQQGITLADLVPYSTWRRSWETGALEVLRSAVT